MSIPASTVTIVRLFVANEKSAVQVFEKASLLCAKMIRGEHRIEIIDLSKDPDAAEREDVLATPCLRLVKKDTVQNVIGDLSAIKFDSHGGLIMDDATREFLERYFKA